MGVQSEAPTAPSDQSLMLAVSGRSEDALRALYDRYGALVFTLALRRLGDRGLAEEVLQDVFLRCWEHAASYRPDAGSVSAWLFGITRHRTIDVRRGALARARQCEQPASGPASGTESMGRSACDVERLSERLMLLHALQTLPGPQREAIELAYYGELSQSQIAALLGAPLGTIKTRVRAGLERLRHAIQSPSAAETTLAAGLANAVASAQPSPRHHAGHRG